MESIADGHSIVIVGSWNPSIFAPAWVAANLTQTKEIGLQVAITRRTPIRLAFDRIFLRVDDSKLTLQLQEISEASFVTMEAVAKRILNELPHTPVSGIGVNFKFLEEEPPIPLLETFRLDDQGMLADAGATVRTTTLRRALAWNDGSLNLSMELTERGDVSFDFNFHRDIHNANEAVAHLEAGMAHFREAAINLLATVYELTQAATP